VEAFKDLPSTNIRLKLPKGTASHFKTDIFKRIMFYIYDAPGEAPFPLSIDAVKEIIEMNRQGIVIDDVEDFMAEEVEVEETDFAQVVGQDSLTRFDQKRRPKGRGNQRGRGRNDNRPRPQGQGQQGQGQGQGQPRNNPRPNNPRPNNPRPQQPRPEGQGGAEGGQQGQQGQGQPRQQGPQRGGQRGGQGNRRPNPNQNKGANPNQNKPNDNKPQGGEA